MPQPTVPGSDLGEILESGQSASQPADLDWLEKMAPAVKKQPQKSDDDDEQKQKQQLERLKELDKKRSREMYEAIQQEILKLEKQREEERRRGMAKNITGATGFDQQQINDPEGYIEKMKKKQAAAKNDLSAATKASMGTGEANRGAVG